MKEDIFAYGPNFMRSGWVDYSCKFSGLFEIAEEGELSNYDPNVKKPRMNIKDYTMKNTASVVGSLRTYDSAVTLYDDGQIAPIYDDQFEFGLN